MIKRFTTSFSTPVTQFVNEACKTLPSKCGQELLEAFRLLVVWKEYFQSKYGELEALSHLSNPDDPPDVIAHFKRGDLAIEITGIDPAHIRQSDDLHNKVGQSAGRTEIPLSIKPANRQEALDMMYLPGQSPCEDVPERNQVWFDSIVGAVRKKLAKKTIRNISPGIILLLGKIDGSFGEDRAVERAIVEIREKIPSAQDWAISVMNYCDVQDYFSAIDDPATGFEIKRMHARV